MAKRFSETKIWDDTWYEELPVIWKLVWKYLCDKCDEAGIWKPNFKLADFQIGQKIKWDDADKYLNKGKVRILISDKAWILKDFISFQYGEKVYTSEHGFHKKIRKMISEYPIDTLSNRVYDTLQEEEEVKEEVNKGIVKGGGFVPPTFGDVKAYCASAGIALNETEIGRLIDFYQSKGWMVGKTKMKDWKASVRNWARSVKDRTKFFDGKPINQAKPINELPTRRENPDPKMQEEVSKLISQTAKQLKERVSV